MSGIKKNWFSDIRERVEVERKIRAEAAMEQFKEIALPKLKSFSIPDEALLEIIPGYRGAWEAGFTEGVLYAIESYEKHLAKGEGA